jgi:hypothetical protein
MTSAHDAAMTATRRSGGDALPWPPIRCGVVIVLLAAWLAGCGMLGDDTASRMMVTPRKYQFHNCKLLAAILIGQRTRVADLEKLSARAAQGPGGQMIASAAYRSEYLQTRGEIAEIEAMIAEKNCKSESDWRSDRSMY